MILRFTIHYHMIDNTEINKFFRNKNCALIISRVNHSYIHPFAQNKYNYRLHK